MLSFDSHGAGARSSQSFQASSGCRSGSGSWKKSWRLLLVRSFATLVQASGDSTGVEVISVWEGSCGLHGKGVCCPTAHPHTRGLILSASDRIRNMLFSTFLTHHTFCTVASTVFFGRVIVCCAMVRAKCLHLIVSLYLNSLTMGTAAEVVASDILVGAQPRIRCWARARFSSSELVDTATARRQQQVEDAARVGLQFPFRSERRGRGAPSVAMEVA